jgi:hypothetical protein
MTAYRAIGWKAAALLQTLVWCTVCQACPTCRYGIAERTAQSGIIQGYFWSILFMMSMPFLILGGLSAYFYYQVRQARNAQRVVAAARLDEVAHSG